MMLIEESPVADAVLPVEEFKAHLRMGTGFGEETLQEGVLTSFLRAALATIEGRTGRVLLERVFVWTVPAWRGAQGHEMPVGPVKALNQIEMVYRDGTRVPVANDGYWLEQAPGVPRLRPAGVCLPAIPQGGHAEITFLAGYGSDWVMIPPDLRQAVLLLAAHYYEFRHETSLSEGCMPFGVVSLIERYKVMRLYAGGAVT